MSESKREIAVEQFNPDALNQEEGVLTIDLTQTELTYPTQPVSGFPSQASEKLYKILLDRPQGDIYAHLVSEIDRLAVLNEPLTVEQKQSFAEAGGTIICVAMWDLAMPPESRVIVRKVYANLVPLGEMYWRTLVLYRTVVRYSEAMKVPLPEEMKNERIAWGRSILRSAGLVTQHRSKTSYRSLLSKYAKDLKRRINPCNQSEPEDLAFIDYALKFSHWDETIRDAESKLEPSERKRRGNLRKDIRDAINGLSTSMTALARFYKENTYIVALAPDSKGRYCVVSDRNRLTPIEDKLPKN